MELSLNWADFAVIGIIILSTVISVIRGLIKETVSLITWISAIWVTLSYTPDLSSQLAPAIGMPMLQVWSAALILFISTLVVGSLINYLIGLVLPKAKLSKTNRLLGGVFGLLRGVVVVVIVVMLASLTPFPQDNWWRQSKFLPVFQNQITIYKVYLPQSIAENFNFSRDTLNINHLPTAAPNPAADESES